MLFISYLGPTLTMRFVFQAQASGQGGANWWLWLIVLLIAALIVAWLLGHEGAYKPSLNVAAKTSPATAPSASAQENVAVESPVASMTTAAKTKAAPTVRAAGISTVDHSEGAQSSAVAKAEVVALEAAAKAPTAVVVSPGAERQKAAAKPDNLTVIEGIGPKINSILHEAGINTFQDLANAETDVIKEILVQAGLRIHDPETWPEQAAYAMRGDWDGLKALQAQLSGGRRV